MCPDGPPEFRASLTEWGIDHVPWEINKTGLNPFGDLPALVSLWRLLRRRRPDIIFAHTIKPVIYGLLLARITRPARAVALLPGLGYAFTAGIGWRRRLARLLAHFAYSLVLPAADLVVVQNPDDRDQLIRRRLLRPERGVVVNGSGVDLAAFVPVPLPFDPPTFLMVSRLLRDKGVYEYVEAARRVKMEIPEARFLLAGGTHPNPNSVSKAEVDGWCAEGTIEYLGQVPDVRPHIKRSHVFVLPSYYGEGIPRAALEALAMGRPIVTTDEPGCRETVDGRNGVLVPARNIEALVLAMLDMARSDRGRLQSLGAASRALAERRFDVRDVSESTANFILG